MNNLTSILNAKLSGVDAEEFTKQGGLIEMTAGNIQRIAAMTMPAITVRLNYTNLSKTEWDSLRLAYEQNHSNTFIYESSVMDDARLNFISSDASVWTFSSWEFSTDAKTRVFSGFINIVTSVYFNYAEYLALGNQTSTYNFVQSTNEDWSYLLNYIPPYKIKYSYTGNSLRSSIMRSSNHIKDRGGLRKIWVLNWLIVESDFLQLIKFYRQYGGVFRTFGMVGDGGYSMSEPYIESEKDYVEDGYFLEWYSGYNPETTNHSCMFSQDGFKYKKRVDGLYEAEVQLVEVL